MIIFGISGQKGSGKSTLAKDIARFCYDSFAGQVSTFYSIPFAGPIKEIAVNLLGLDRDCVYGDDAKKNTFTKYKWGDMPHYLQLQADGNAPPADQFMTHRQIQQELGCGIIRRMWPDAFCNAWEMMVRSIADYDNAVVYTDDLRFPNELSAIIRYAERYCFDYYTIRLTRGATTDKHISETALSNDSPGFDFVIDNEKSTKLATFNQLVKLLPISETAKQIALLRAGAYYANSV